MFQVLSWLLNFFLICSAHAASASTANSSASTPRSPIAAYSFDEGVGTVVSDSSGHHNDGAITGGATWTTGIHGAALILNGTNSIRIPSSASLDVSHALSVSAWIRGHASGLHFVDGYSEFRSSYFQVVGDKIHLVTNSDEWPDSLLQKDSSEWGAVDDLKDVWHIWTGVTDINLTDWSYVKRTAEPYSGIEPKLQVVGNEIYYEYFGQDENKAWQIWTATSNSDGSNWRVTQRTHEQSGYRVEQDSNLQVAQRDVYIGYPEKDQSDIWQLHTAIFNRDGSNYRSIQRTYDTGWIPALQVYGNQVYYLYFKPNFRDKNDTGLFYELWLARSDRNGSNWQPIRKVCDGTFYAGWGGFTISNGYVYLIYGALRLGAPQQWTDIFTARMDLDGAHFQQTRRTFGDGFVRTPNTGALQVVGNKVYYTYYTSDTEQSLAEMHLGPNASLRLKRTLWTAESNVDGSQWRATKRDTADDLTAPYRGIEVVGAKEYFGAAHLRPHVIRQEALGVSGANIVSKGDAFGIGVTEDGRVRGFINAGQDYLYRGEAPTDIAGAVADSMVDERWHHVAITYDEQSLILYVDGQPKASMPYTRAPGRNPFPMLIGDGFQGLVDEVSIYDRVLGSAEVRSLAQQFALPARSATVH